MNKQNTIPNVNYIGYKPNEFIKENLKNYHMFVYPNVFGKKHSCIAAIEAMAAGLYTVSQLIMVHCLKLALSFQLYVNYRK
jgi:hypothetical protein